MQPHSQQYCRHAKPRHSWSRWRNGRRVSKCGSGPQASRAPHNARHPRQSRSARPPCRIHSRLGDAARTPAGSAVPAPFHSAIAAGCGLCTPGWGRGASTGRSRGGHGESERQVRRTEQNLLRGGEHHLTLHLIQVISNFLALRRVWCVFEL